MSWSYSLTRMKNINLLDVSFTAEEESRAVSKLKKKKKAPGPDGLLVEHLKAGGEAVVI